MKKIHPEVLCRFGRDPKIIFERDIWRCLICKSNNDLTIDHIDGNGRHSKKPNNNINNLRTLCRKCHGRVDGKRGRGGKHNWNTRPGYKPEISRYKNCLICGKRCRVMPATYARKKTCSTKCQYIYLGNLYRGKKRNLRR